LQPGDTVLFITDGITEAMNARLEEFGAARVKAVFDSKPRLGPAECIDVLLAAVDAFAGGVEPSDDITCLAICHRPSIHPAAAQG
jgi:serine phosphatase RsbU (regulator of sigma subunit)